MKFSVCIPNYNYGRYIGETIRSVLAQDAEFEVLVADNASTDDSVLRVTEIADPRIRLHRNRWNVGFAGNLDRACQAATGDRMILLSSDDLAGPAALATYARLAAALGPAAGTAVFCSDQHVIDGDGKTTGHAELDARQWADARPHAELSTAVGARIVAVPARSLLRRALLHLRTPMAFATTCYPRSLYEAVEGYGGGSLVNPDKYFVWKILSVAEHVYYVDQPLFSYRVHAANQNSLQRSSGALKHLVDQYRATFDTAPEVLAAAGLTKDDLARAFIEHDVVLRGLKSVAEGERTLARRHYDFGRSTYPALLAASRRARLLRAALWLGPIGTALARRRLESALASYRQGGFVDDDRRAPAHG
jgi:glycosyltransferase involved in cell wall biosynthesis